MAKQKNLFLPEWINGKILGLVLAGMFIAHLVIFVIYSSRSSSYEFKVNRGIIARQIINFIQTLQNTPEEEQPKVVKALDLPNFKVTLDPKPKFPVQFVDASLWQVLKRISEQSPEIQFSFKLATEQWLNITVDVIQDSWGLQSVLFSLEFIAILAILFSLWTIHRFTKPLQTIAMAAERLGVDLHAEPLPIYGPRVAQVTARAMNPMQQRIRDLVQARTQMLAAISHDLRTPITRLKLRAQYLEGHEEIDKFVSDLDEMDAMISQTLSFARENHQSEKRVLVDVNSLLSTLCDDFQELGKKVRFTSNSKRIPIYGGNVALKRIFTNLIENAIKYAGNADVSITLTDSHVLVYIDDNGPGIPES